MICPSCGKTILDTSKFCPFCGVSNAAAAAEAPADAGAAQPQPDYTQNANQNYQQPYQQNYQPYGAYNAPAPEVAPETTKPRSAYWAAVLHVFAGLLGFGYYYRGMKEKAKNCIICFIVGAVLSPLFGIGAIVLCVCQIINLVEAVKLFKGDYQYDAYGRTLYQEF